MYKLFKRFQRKEVSMILLCLLFIVGQVWLDLTMPDYMSEITTLVQTEVHYRHQRVFLNASVLT